MQLHVAKGELVNAATALERVHVPLLWQQILEDLAYSNSGAEGPL